MRPLRHGVFVVRGAPVGEGTELWIAVLSTAGVLGFATAAHLWRMDDQPDRIHLIVGSQRRVRPAPGLRRHHVFVPRSARTTIDGLPVTSRTWTLLDHIGRLPRPAAVRLTDRALQCGWLARRDISRRLRDYPGRQGNTQLRILLALTADGAAAESERLLQRMLRAAGISGWRANYVVRQAGRFVACIDVAVPAAMLAIEVDGFAYHSAVDRFERDRQRQNRLVGLGWTVLRFTWYDLAERPDEVIATICAHLPRS